MNGAIRAERVMISWVKFATFVYQTRIDEEDEIGYSSSIMFRFCLCNWACVRDVFLKEIRYVVTVCFS